MTRGHFWKTSHFATPSYCLACGNIVLGFAFPGLTCSLCRQVIHKKCRDRGDIQFCSHGRERTNTEFGNKNEKVSSTIISTIHRVSRSASVSFSKDQNVKIEIEHNFDQRASLEQYMESSKKPVCPSIYFSPFLFNWKSVELDDDDPKYEGIADRLQVSIVICESNVCFTSEMFRVFFNQSKVMVTNEPFQEYLKNSTNFIYNKKKKLIKKRTQVETIKFANTPPTSIINPSPSPADPVSPAMKRVKKRGLLASFDDDKKISKKFHNVGERLLRKTRGDSDVSECIELSDHLDAIHSKALFLPEAGDPSNVNCIIITGNSIGQIFDRSVVEFINDLIGGNFEHIIEKRIAEQFFGEAPIHTCFFIPCANTTSVNWIGYIVNSVNSTDTYNQMWNLLSCIWKHNQSVPLHSRVTSFIFTPQFNKQDPTKSALQLYLAYRTFIKLPVNGIHKFGNYNYKEKMINAEPPPGEVLLRSQKDFFTYCLLNGEIAKRGFISPQELDWLLEYLNTPNLAHVVTTEFPAELFSDIQESAARVISEFAFPDQKFPGIREKVLSSGSLEPLLHFVCDEKIRVHREIAFSEIQLGPLIARGASGVVYKGVYNGAQVAVKMFRPFISEQERLEFFREVGICSMLQHENLMTCVGAHTLVSHKDEERFLVTSLMSRGNLNTFLNGDGKKTPQKIRMKMALDCAKGMDYLHRHNIVHRDLKSFNLLLGDDFRIQVIDFGTSRISSQDKTMTSNTGTTMWMAPEIFAEEKYDKPVDVYSFAIVLWELLTCKQPFDDLPVWNIPNLVMKGERPVIQPSDAPTWLIKLLKRCWHQKPHKRPTFSEIVSFIHTNLELEDGSGVNGQSALPTVSSQPTALNNEGRKKKKMKRAYNSTAALASLVGDGYFSDSQVRAKKKMSDL